MQITPVQALKRFSTWRGHFWVLAAVLLVQLWMTGVHFRQHAVDYSTYYRAGKWILEGRVAEVYQPELQGMGGFLYPIVAAYFFAPFAALGEWQGKALFYLLIWASLGLGVWFSLRICKEATGRTPAPAQQAFLAWGALLFNSRAINDVLLSANLNGVLFALMAAVYLLREARPRASGILLGFCCSIKFFPLMGMGYFFWERRWRALGWAAGSFAVLYAAPFFLSGWEQGLELFSQHLRVLADDRNYGSLHASTFQNLPAFFARVFASLGVDLSPMAATLPVALLLMTPFFIGPFLDPSRMTVQVRARLFAVALYWIPLINPASWFNMGLFYLPLAMLSLLEVNRRWFGLLGFFVFYTLTGRGLLGQEGYARVAAWNLPFFGVMLLLFSQMGSQVLGNPGSARRPGYQPRT